MLEASYKYKKFKKRRLNTKYKNKEYKQGREMERKRLSDSNSREGEYNKGSKR